MRHSVNSEIRNERPDWQALYCAIGRKSYSALTVANAKVWWIFAVVLTLPILSSLAEEQLMASIKNIQCVLTGNSDLVKEEPMGATQRFYQIHAIPADDDPSLMRGCVDGIAETVHRESAKLLDLTGNALPGSCSLNIYFYFSPQGKKLHPQSRLQVFLTLNTNDPSSTEAVVGQLESGCLSRFYRKSHGQDNSDTWKISGLPAIPWDDFIESCSVVRQVQAIKPVVTPAENRFVPTFLRKDLPLESNSANNYMELDRVLDDVSSPILIHMCAMPYDATSEREATAQYGAHLEMLGRTFGQREQDSFQIAYTDENTSLRSRDASSSHQRPEPLARDVLTSAIVRGAELDEQNLLFSCSVFACEPGLSRAIAGAVAGSAFQEACYDFVTCNKAHPHFWCSIRAANQGEVSNIIDPLASKFEADPQLYSQLSGLRQLARPIDLHGLFQLPIATALPTRCLFKSTDSSSINADWSILLGHDVPVNGMPSTVVERRISNKLLNKHLLWTSLPGNGKTTGSANMLVQLRQHNVPWIAFQPTWSEFNSLLLSESDPDRGADGISENLRIYTPGHPGINPLLFNPLKRFSWVNLDTHIDRLMEVFEATMPLEGPLAGILRKALYRVYQRYPDLSSPPTMSEFLKACKEVLWEQGYDAELRSNLLAALENRFGLFTDGTLGKIFEPGVNCPEISDLVEGHSIIDLSALPTTSRATLMLLYLVCICEYLKHAPVPDRDNQLVIMMDELHLIAPSPQLCKSSPEFVNQAAAAAEVVCSLLREFRKLKVGLVLFDQSCTNIAPDVLKMTGTKIVMRTVDSVDRQMMGAAMLFTDTEYEHVARLMPGEAYLFCEGFHRPCLFRAVHLQQIYPRLAAPPPFDEIASVISSRDWFRVHHEAASRANLAWVRRELDYVNSIHREVGVTSRILERNKSAKSASQGAAQRTAAALKRKLENAIARYYFELYKPIMSHIRVDAPADVQQTKARIASEFEAKFGDTVKSLLSPKTDRQTTLGGTSHDE